MDTSVFATNTTHANTCDTYHLKKLLSLSNTSLVSISKSALPPLQSFSRHIPSSYSASHSFKPTFKLFALKPCHWHSVIKMSTRPLTRSYAVANLETMDDVDPPPTDTEAFHPSEKRTADEVETSGGDTEPDIPVKAKRGRSAGPKKPAAGTIVIRHQPIRQNRVLDPAGPDRPRPIRTSVEVKAAATRKAQLEQELEKLNEQKIQAMAEMDAQEELEDEEEEHLRATHIANTTSMDGVDDIDEVSSGEEQESLGTDFVNDSEGSEKVQTATKVPAKQTSVCLSLCVDFVVQR